MSKMPKKTSKDTPSLSPTNLYRNPVPQQPTNNIYTPVWRGPSPGQVYVAPVQNASPRPRYQQQVMYVNNSPQVPQQSLMYIMPQPAAGLQYQPQQQQNVRPILYNQASVPVFPAQNMPQRRSMPVPFTHQSQKQIPTVQSVDQKNPQQPSRPVPPMLARQSMPVIPQHQLQPSRYLPPRQQSLPMSNQIPVQQSLPVRSLPQHHSSAQLPMVQPQSSITPPAPPRPPRSKASMASRPLPMTPYEIEKKKRSKVPMNNMYPALDKLTLEDDNGDNSDNEGYEDIDINDGYVRIHPNIKTNSRECIHSKISKEKMCPKNVTKSCPTVSDVHDGSDTDEDGYTDMTRFTQKNDDEYEYYYIDLSGGNANK